MNVALVLKVMGGTEALMRSFHSEVDFADMIVSGIPPIAVRNIQVYIDANDTEMAKMMHISPKTYRTRKSFKGDEGDHAYRIAKVVARAEEVIGSHKIAIKWLQSEQPVLGNRIPFELISTSADGESVPNCITKIR